MHFEGVPLPAFALLCFQILIVSEDLRPVSGLEYSGLDGAARYLSLYGYLDGKSGPNDMSLTDLRTSLLAFQKKAGLEPTGILDEETVGSMNEPRCGNKDVEIIFANISDEAHSPYNIAGGQKWEKRRITYRISQYSSQRISRETIDLEIHRAFQLWAEATDLQFIRSNAAEVDIEILFTYGAHGDQYPFSLVGVTQLAHAFYPGTGLGGDIHFNENVDWLAKNTLLYAAAHEIGHSLGLRHSDNREALMYSHLINLKDQIELHWDDVMGIQDIYGGRSQRQPQPRPRIPTTTTTTTTPHPTRPARTTTTTVNPERSDTSRLCQDPRIDAITSLDSGEILVFKDEYVHFIHNMNGALVPRTSRTIKDVFSNRLPSSIDAAFTLNKNKLYFFKGNLYWRATGLTIDEGFPREIRRHLPGLPDDLDAAMVWSNGLMYFFKGSEYWTLKPNQRGRDRRRRVSKAHGIGYHWAGMPERDLDAAFRSPSGHTYFFKGQDYWRFNDTGNAVSVAQPSYPRETRKYWFSCASSPAKLSNL